MKRMLAAISFFLLIVSLTSCYKSETTTFAETTYVLEKAVTFDEVQALNDVQLKLTEITVDEYTSANKINVIASRYDDKYYKVELNLNIDGVEYPDFTTQEIPGSSAYPGRYRLMFDLQIGDKAYPCLFRMDLHHYTWEASSIEEDQATSLRVDILEAIDNDGKTNGKKLATFSLMNQDSSKQ